MFSFAHKRLDAAVGGAAKRLTDGNADRESTRFQDGAVRVLRGEWRGRIGRVALGTNGFGYDPVFIPAESDAAGHGRTSAELSPAEKDALSHRGRALRLMLPILQEVLDRP
jgi:inosine/xanthosine triphosphate pyrophosphatase family protein